MTHLVSGIKKALTKSQGFKNYAAEALSFFEINLNIVRSGFIAAEIREQSNTTTIANVSALH